MNREEYMKELENNLRAIPEQEKEEVLNFYSEYLADMEENRPEDFNSLDAPEQIAAQVRADVAMRTLKEPAKKRKSGISTTWTVLLAIFALPVGLPLAISAAAIALSLIIVAASLVVSLAATALALGLYGILSVIAAIAIIPANIASSVFYLGLGLLGMSLGYLLAIGVYNLSKRLFTWIAGFINNMRLRMQNRQSRKSEVKQ